MSAPNLIWWFPWIRVQLLTTWNWSSFSVNGQLQRPTFKPSPKDPESAPATLLPVPFLKPFPVKWNRDKPPVVGGPATPGPLFKPGTPKASIGEALLSEKAVCGLYRNQPKRTSVSHFVPIALLKPVAKL